MGAGAKEKTRRAPTRYTPEMKKQLKAEGDARRAKTAPALKDAKSLGEHAANGVKAIKNAKSLRDKQIEDAGG